MVVYCYMNIAKHLEENLKRQLKVDQFTVGQLEWIRQEHIYQEKNEQDRQDAQEME